ncbi:MAG: glutamate synthase-related protein, partial [Candidatus Omnitrophica bacterium]|nr:glutamate synthase-related protein [Candidatus Omnitrophota bacterium]
GCVMLRHCHLNNCSVGVATQDEDLGKRFAGKPEYLQRYFYFVAEEVRGIMAELGARKLDELIGRTELIELNTGILNWKAKNVDLSRILYKPQVPSYVGTRCAKKQDHGLDKVMDLKLIESAKPALDNKDHVKVDLSIKNTDRAVGAMLSGEIARRYGEKGLSDDTIHFKFTGTAGQSFGAFLARGVVFEVEGEANDYVGKGLSGGRIIIYPPKGSAFESPENIIIGNTTFYGATSGEAYICGVAGERFCIRNSGIYAVIEGVGDHGCEYMTGGRVVILGKTGRNFAAGMSGGIAYAYDEDREFKARCNMGMVAFEALDGEDTATIQKLLSNHIRYTHSAKAKAVLDDFGNAIRHFIKVMPVEYKRALEGRLMRKDVLFEEVSDG